MSTAPHYDRMKHLDYIQSVISRLANNSFLMKGWALTLCSAMIGFSVSRTQASLALVALVPAVAFALLDAYYLRQERAFRSMFREVAESEEVQTFDMNPAPYAKKEKWRSAFCSFSIATFYGLIIAVALLVLIAVSSQPGAWGTTVVPPPSGSEPAPTQTCSPR